MFGVMKKMKNKLNDEMGYFKGMPKGTYCEVLDEMMHTKVNSSVTSSIPLAEFWQPDNLVRMQKILNPHLAGLTLEKDLKFFEMPVDPIWRGKVYPLPSVNWQTVLWLILTRCPRNMRDLTEQSLPFPNPRKEWQW